MIRTLRRFQSPEGDSLFFYLMFVLALAMVILVIRFQSPEGDSLFFYESVQQYNWYATARFQSPEGDSGLCYLKCHEIGCPDACFSPPKGIQVFVTWGGLPHKAAAWLVSVPRRGFRSLLHAMLAIVALSWIEFQSPEGDSGLCYSTSSSHLQTAIVGFSPPKGIQVFVTGT